MYESEEMTKFIKSNIETDIKQVYKKNEGRVVTENLLFLWALFCMQSQ